MAGRVGWALPVSVVTCAGSARPAVGVEGGELYVHYSTGFTNDPLYPSLAINGDFDPVNYGPSTPPDQRYPFTDLRNRILPGP